MGNSPPPYVYNSTYSDSANWALYVVPKVTGMMSIIGSLSIIVWVCMKTKKQRKVYDRLLAGMSAIDMLGSFAFFLGVWPIEVLNNTQSSGFCTFQAFSIQLASAIFFYNGMLATNFMLRIKFDFKESDSIRWEPWFHVCAWAFPLCSAIACLALGLYGPAGIWCWISPKYGSWAWWALFYAELWLIMIYSIVCMGIIIQKVLENDRKMADTLQRRERKFTKHAKQVAFQGIGFSVAFLLTWVFGTANRIQQTVNPGNPVFGLIILHSWFVPWQGFLNFLVFMHPRYVAWKEHGKNRGFRGLCYKLISLPTDKSDTAQREGGHVKTGMSTTEGDQVHSPAPSRRSLHASEKSKSPPRAKPINQAPAHENQPTPIKEEASTDIRKENGVIGGESGDNIAKEQSANRPETTTAFATAQSDNVNELAIV